MHNLVPYFIQENLSRGVRRGEFTAASLFVDISGFSTMTDALMAHGPHGAEVLANLMRKVFDPLIRSIYEQGGFVAGLAGDAFTAVFPLESGQAGCLNAIAAGWQIQRWMAELANSPTVYGVFQLSAKIGMALGEVAWGIVSARAGNRSVYYFQGPGVDECAAAEHKATAGEIILSPALYEQLRARVTAEPAGDYFRVTQVAGDLPLPQPVSLPPADLEIQRLFFPEALLTQVHSGEFRQVVNLFIRLPTVRTEAQLDIFMQTLFDLQDQYGGHLNRLDFGDKGSNLLLFWGAPVAYENDVQRALNFILDLQARTSLPINAGVTYQIAHAGFTGSDLHEEYTAFGRGVNLAARFMSSSGRGEIWLDEQAARRAEAQFEIEPVGAMAFKGFDEKQAVYLLYERKEEVEASYAGGLVGRAAELERLSAFVAPVWEGRYAGVLLVWGEPGIGKSRLVVEFRASALFAERPALWVVCRANEILRTPLNPFRSPLWYFFEQSEAQTEARNKRSFNRKLEELIEATQQSDGVLADELDRTRSFLGELVNLHWPDSLYEQLDAQGRYENTLIALTTLLRALSLLQPVILVLEDVHWLDEDSLHYLLAFERTLTSDETKSYPIAVIATARREGTAGRLKELLSPKEIDLGRLPGDDIARIAEFQLGGRIAPGLLALLMERAQGNPFFAEQIVRYLQEQRLLEQGAGGWRTVGPGSQSPLPADVRAVLVARLDRLAREVREVVQTAAVLGQEFEIQLLSGMLRNDESILQKVVAAEQAAIWSRLDELLCLFRHALLREAAYQMQVRARRQALHALAAEALERLHSGDLSPHYGELAYHAEMAGLVDKARLFFQRAGDTARENFQNSQAVNDYSRALVLTPAADLESRYVLLMARAALYNLLGDRTAQREDLDALERIATALCEDAAGAPETWRQAAVAVRRADYLSDSGDFQGAVAAAKEALALADPEIAPEVALTAYRIWSDGLHRQGNHAEAARQAEAGLELARKVAERKGESRLLNMLGLIAYEARDPAAARIYFEQSIQIAHEIGDRRGEAIFLNNLGNVAGSEGDFASARNDYEQALRIARETGNRGQESTMVGNLGWIAKVQGDYASASAYLEQHLRSVREVGDRYQEAYTLVNLSSLALRQEDCPKALAYAGHSLILTRETGDRSAEAWSLLCQGDAYFQMGAFSRAEGAYRESLDIRRSLEQPHLAAEPLAGLAQVALARADLPTARARVDAILAHLDGGGTLEGAEEPLQVYLVCYRVLQAQADPRAAAVLKTAYDLLQAQAGQIGDERMRSRFLEHVPTHREILAAWTTQ
jgi:predicted ATPase/class 3 adenylate cyclase